MESSALTWLSSVSVIKAKLEHHKSAISVGTNIEKGVLITTGAFTREAKEEASSEGKRLIDLMDGEELINKLAEYGIGLNEVKSYEIDEDFFNSLEEESI